MMTGQLIKHFKQSNKSAQIYTVHVYENCPTVVQLGNNLTLILNNTASSVGFSYMSLQLDAKPPT